MDAPEREPSRSEEPDPLRAYALQNAAIHAAKPRSSMGPFLVSVLVTAVILAFAYYVWGR